MTPIAKAAASVGGQSRLAELLGVKPPTVNQWVLGRRQVPAARCPEVERLSAVRCEDLRPDVNWAVLRGTAAPESADA